jgi:hypothetical protein
MSNEAGDDVLIVNFIPEEIHVLATRLATYVSSDSTTAKVTNQQLPYGLIRGSDQSLNM